VRNEHWKDRPAKPHDAAAYADREDDHAPGKHRLTKKSLQRPLLDDDRFGLAQTSSGTTALFAIAVPFCVIGRATAAVLITVVKCCA
jgi:hypothetical protein